MTNILSTLRGSGVFCVKLVRNTSKLLSRILNFYNDQGLTQVINQETNNDIADPPDVTESQSNSRWPSTVSYVPGTPSRSDSQCSCFSCAIPSIPFGDRPRRSSKLNEGVPVEKFYKFGELLGEGTFSKVYLAEPLTEPSGLVAVKVIEKSSLIRKKKPEGSLSEEQDGHIQEYEDLRWLIDREIQVMSPLDHAHIIHLEEVYEDEEKVCFILELAKGGEVFDRLIEKVTFDEAETASLLVQLLCAVAFMHEQGIVHRDLKLENLLYYDDTEDSKILVADFGLSEFEWELEEGSPVCGTPGYLSPEVIARQPCTTAADVWSIGVITYILLAGYPPFFAKPDEEDNDQTLFKKILTGEYEFHESSWSHISPEARDFIRCLLCPDPLQRPTCEEALAHPWLNDRQNLEMRAAQKRTHSEMSSSKDKWSLTQQAAFGLSLFIIVYSYIGLIAYVFNLGDVSAALYQEFKEEYLNNWSWPPPDFVTLYSDNFNWLAESFQHFLKTFYFQT